MDKIAGERRSQRRFDVRLPIHYRVSQKWVMARMGTGTTCDMSAGSVVLDFSRRALKAHDRGKFNLWWTGSTALGFLFLAGQAMAWYQLKEAGVFIATNPSSSFFYVLTAAHAFHLVGGVTALVYVDVQAWRLRLGPAKRTTIDVAAIFWHFLCGLWLMLMVLFYVWG